MGNKTSESMRQGNLVDAGHRFPVKQEKNSIRRILLVFLEEMNGNDHKVRDKAD